MYWDDETPAGKLKLINRLKEIAGRIVEIETEYNALADERAKLEKRFVVENRKVFQEQSRIPDATTKMGQVYRLMSSEPERIWEIDDIIEQLSWQEKDMSAMRTRVRVYLYKLMDKPLVEHVRRGGYRALPSPVTLRKR